jgi:hypothetical protein
MKNNTYVTILKNAKEQLAHRGSDLHMNGKQTFICHAIGLSEHSYPLEVNQLKSLIDARLEGEATYVIWLDTKYPDVYDAYSSTNYEQIQLSRHAWVDSLIEEFS